jgi:hypothetical protein
MFAPFFACTPCPWFVCVLTAQVRLVGEIKVRKDKGVKDFKAMRKELGRAQLMLKKARIDLEGFEFELQHGDVNDGELQGLQSHVTATQTAEQDIRRKFTRAVEELAAVEPLFPEVMVHVESTVPRELLCVWRPACALEDVFERIEKISASGRHNVWHCTGGRAGEDFAVKVFKGPMIALEP